MFSHEARIAGMPKISRLLNRKKIEMRYQATTLVGALASPTTTKELGNPCTENSCLVLVRVLPRKIGYRHDALPGPRWQHTPPTKHPLNSTHNPIHHNSRDNPSHKSGCLILAYFASLQRFVLQFALFWMYSSTHRIRRGTLVIAWLFLVGCQARSGGAP